MKTSPSISNQRNYVQVNGLRMYYEIHGIGIPVILLHGGLENCQMWAPVIPTLSQIYQVITPDTRGHGRTDNPSGKFSFPLLAEDIALLIQALGLQDPLVAGYSGGGQTALHMAMIYPGLVEGYIIGGIFNSMTDEWRQMMQGPLGFEGPGLVDIERVIQTNAEFISSLEEKHDVFHEPGYWKSLLKQVSQAWWEPPIHNRADFAKISDPLLFWCGDRDVFCPPEQSLEMYRKVDKAELAIIPNADHFTMAGQLEIVSLVLMDFMKGVIKPNWPGRYWKIRKSANSCVPHRFQASINPASFGKEGINPLNMLEGFIFPNFFDFGFDFIPNINYSSFFAIDDFQQRP